MTQGAVAQPPPTMSTGRSILLVLSGTIGAQAALIVSLPLIARLYTPSDFGTYSYLTSTALVIAGIANLRLDAAIPLPRSSRTAADVIWVASGSAAAVSILTAAVLAVIAPRVSGDHVLASRWAWTLPPMIFVIAQFSVWNQAALRHQLFAMVAKRPIMQNVGTALLQLSLASCRLGAGGLLLGQLGTRMLTTAMMAWSSRALLQRPSLSRMIRALRRYSRFPLLMAPAAVLNALGLYLPILLITNFYGAMDGGIVSLAQQLLLLPSATIGTAVGQVYVAQLARNLREESTGNLSTFRRASLVLGTCGLTFTILLAVVAPPVLPLVLGEAWAAAGPVIVASSIASACGLVAAPLSNVLVATERTWTVLLLDAARCVLVGGCGLLAVHLGSSSVQTVFSMSVAQALVYLATWGASLAVVRSQEYR